MEDNKVLRQQLATMRQSFFDEGILDKHYVQVEELEDKDNPHFAEEVMTMFFRDSTKLIATVEHALEKSPCDLPKMDKYLHQLKALVLPRCGVQSTNWEKFWKTVTLKGEVEKFSSNSPFYPLIEKYRTMKPLFVYPIS